VGMANPCSDVWTAQEMHKYCYLHVLGGDSIGTWLDH